jgi:hypothetical protein
MPAAIELTLVGLVVVYIVVLVFGNRAAFETFAENRRFSRWSARASSANPPRPPVKKPGVCRLAVNTVFGTRMPALAARSPPRRDSSALA